MYEGGLDVRFDELGRKDPRRVVFPADHIPEDYVRAMVINCTTGMPFRPWGTIYPVVATGRENGSSLRVCIFSPLLPFVARRPPGMLSLSSHYPEESCAPSPSSRGRYQIVVD